MYNVTLEKSFFPAQESKVFQPETIYGLMSKQAGTYGEKIALQEVPVNQGESFEGRRWSYRELHSDAERLAQALASRHERGERLAVFANNLPEWVLMELAAAYAGLVIVTVNPSLRAHELRYILEQSGARAIYYAPQVRGSNLREVIDEALAGLPNEYLLVALTDHAALYDGAGQGELRQTSPEDVVQIQYTSGTTGFPKGALLHQKGLVKNGRDILRRAGVDDTAVVPGFMPLFHTSGCGIMALGGLGCGATILLLSDFDPLVAVSLIADHGANFLMGVPTMLVAVFDVAEATGKDISSVRGLMSGGAMVAAELNRRAQKICGKPVLITYGQTEASPGITGTWPGDSDRDLCETIGQPCPHMDVAIISPGGSEFTGIGEQGEICVRGYNVMTAYNNNVEATKEAIDQAGWLHTGDLGTMDARGYVTITGRVKDMIIRGGENLFPAEIENAMLAHPAIAEVAVVGVPDDKWGERVACFMRVSEAGAGDAGSEACPAASELKAFIRERLSPQKTPEFWIWVEAWPLTGSGKIQKYVLRERFVAGDFAAQTA